MVLRQIAHNPCVPEQPADVALDHGQMQVILAVGVLDRGDALLQPGQFLLHTRHRLGRDPLDLLRLGRLDQLRAVFRQPEIVAGTWKAASAHASDITEADARASLQQIDRLWDELFPAEQARIVALLVERVDIGTEGLNVRLRINGLGGLAREMLAGDIEAAA